ncbi:hypothetical protein HW555_008761, partial [Spodoptera exigua]
KNSEKRFLGLYNDTDHQKKHKYKPQDVISSVSLQLKAIQVADTVKSNKFVSRVLPKCKNSNFLSVSNLPVNNEPPKTKFDTQFATDTQLINIIEDAEIIDIHQGMTQEFETTFCHHTEKVLDEEESEIEEEGNNRFVDVDNDRVDDNTEPERDKEDVNVCDNNFQDRNVEVDTSVSLISPMINSNRVKNEKLAVNHERRNDFGTDIQHVNIIEIDDDDLAIEQPLSPIFVQKVTKPKSKTSSPMVFSLEKFEEFEKQSEPVLIGDHFKISKKIINSQILDKELHIQMDEQIALNAKQSPVLISKAKTKINNKEFKTRLLLDKNSDTDIEVINLDKATTETLIKEAMEDDSKRLKEVKEVLKDEILFSSDEEDLAQQSLQDIPFTCALETSFYDQPDVLDKTMYVGFQTASNKSIQIFTDSFAHAKSILGDVDDDNVTVTDMVKNCESNINNATKDEQQTEVNFDVKNTEFIFNSRTEMEKVADTGQQDPSIFKGFMTASNKQIKLSQKALARSKKVFQDIDINEDFDKRMVDDENIEEIEKGGEIKHKAEVNLNIEDEIQNIDDALIQEFENIEMSLNDDKDKDKIAPIGFRTASNKEIEVADTALTKTKDVFKDINLNEDFDMIELEDDIFDEKDPVNSNEKLKSAIDLGGFKTASNKNIQISKEAISKTKNIFQDLDNIQFPNKPDKVMNKEANSSETVLAISNQMSDFIGFKTAEEALAKTKNLFQDIDNIELPRKETKETCNKEDIVAKPTHSNVFTGFKTANNKHINISEAALAKTMKVFEVKTLKIFQGGSSFVGFKTASNKNIKISDVALARTEHIFKDIDSDNFSYPKKSMETKEHTNLNTETSKTKVFEGFKTGNDKKVNISGKSLADTKNIFKDIEDNNFKHPLKHVKNIKNAVKEGVEAETTDLNRPSTSKARFVGFQTANNKKVNVSKEALVKTRNIFKDILENDSSVPKNMEINATEVEIDDFNKPSTSKTHFIGFQTANNKKISISKESLAKTKDLFKDIDEIGFGDPRTAYDDLKDTKYVDKIEESDTKDVYAPSTSNTSFIGFKTANNKQIQISKQSLAKTKNFFKDIETIDFDVNAEKNEEKLPYPSLQEDIQHMGSTGFGGFKTANNKTIKVSEKALAKTRNIFKDLENVNIEASKKPKKDYPDIEIGDENKEVNACSKAECPQAQEIKIPIFKGFQTANKKPVVISEEALAKSRKLFQDLETVQDEPEPEFHGFKAINNEEMELSQKALIDAVKIFEKELKDGSEFRTEDEKVAPRKENNNENNIRNDVKIVSKLKFGSKNSDGIKTAYDIRTQRPFTDVDTPKDTTKNVLEGIENIINTQVLDHFDQSLHTEDFRETPVKTKRPSSPILSCPKAKKRRKFETPYSQKLPFQFDQLLTFVFKNKRNDLTDSDLTIKYLKEYFSNSVNCKLIPNSWLDNHLKMILWKLISYEVKFKSLFCTVRNVLDQLKFRYDVELFNAKRPALRKIFEKDDVPSKTLVLCVVEIYQDGVSVTSASSTNNMELLLTDGWYCIKANIDKMLAQYVCQGKIVVGTKLVTNGAELVNCEQGVSPWEDISAIRLKLFGNSTRRARWDARLGYHGNAAIMSQLSSVKIDGGKVSKLRVLVTRVYPALYVEKFEDGST